MAVQSRDASGRDANLQCVKSPRISENELGAKHKGPRLSRSHLDFHSDQLRLLSPRDGACTIHSVCALCLRSRPHRSVHPRGRGRQLLIRRDRRLQRLVQSIFDSRRVLADISARRESPTQKPVDSPSSDLLSLDGAVCDLRRAACLRSSNHTVSASQFHSFLS